MQIEQTARSQITKKTKKRSSVDKKVPDMPVKCVQLAKNEAFYLG